MFDDERINWCLMLHPNTVSGSLFRCSSTLRLKNSLKNVSLFGLTTNFSLCPFNSHSVLDEWVYGMLSLLRLFVRHVFNGLLDCKCYSAELYAFVLSWLKSSITAYCAIVKRYGACLAIPRSRIPLSGFCYFRWAAAPTVEKVACKYVRRCYSYGACYAFLPSKKNDQRRLVHIYPAPLGPVVVCWCSDEW